jgi:hypothetical protein
MVFWIMVDSGRRRRTKEIYIYNFSHGKLSGYHLLASLVVEDDDMQGSPVKFSLSKETLVRGLNAGRRNPACTENRGLKLEEPSDFSHRACKAWGRQEMILETLA